MKLTVHSPVLRGAASGSRRCEGCRCTGLPLHEVRIPYSGSGGYWRDLDQSCIDRLRRAPELPPLTGAHDKEKADAAVDHALAALLHPGPDRATPGASAVSASGEPPESSRPSNRVYGH